MSNLASVCFVFAYIISFAVNFSMEHITGKIMDLLNYLHVDIKCATELSRCSMYSDSHT